MHPFSMYILWWLERFRDINMYIHKGIIWGWIKGNKGFNYCEPAFSVFIRKKMREHNRMLKAAQLLKNISKDLIHYDLPSNVIYPKRHCLFTMLTSFYCQRYQNNYKSLVKKNHQHYFNFNRCQLKQVNISLFSLKIQ